MDHMKIRKGIFYGGFILLAVVTIIAILFNSGLFYNAQVAIDPCPIATEGTASTSPECTGGGTGGGTICLDNAVTGETTAATSTVPSNCVCSVSVDPEPRDIPSKTTALSESPAKTELATLPAAVVRPLEAELSASATNGAIFSAVDSALSVVYDDEASLIAGVLAAVQPKVDEFRTSSEQKVTNKTEAVADKTKGIHNKFFNEINLYEGPTAKYKYTLTKSDLLKVNVNGLLTKKVINGKEYILGKLNTVATIDYKIYSDPNVDLGLTSSAYLKLEGRQECGPSWQRNSFSGSVNYKTGYDASFYLYFKGLIKGSNGPIPKDTRVGVTYNPKTGAFGVGASWGK